MAVSVSPAVASAAPIKSALAALRARFEKLRSDGANTAQWRQLQYDAVAALVANQRTYLALESEILALLRSEHPLYSTLRIESLEAVTALEQHHQLVRAIENTLAELG